MEGAFVLGVAGHLLALGFVSLGCAGAQWGGVHMLHPIAPLIFWQLGPSSQLPGHEGSCPRSRRPECGCERAGDQVCVATGACVSLVYFLSGAVPCGRCYGELERRVSRLDGGQRPSPSLAPQWGNSWLGDLGPSKVPFLLRC